MFFFLKGCDLCWLTQLTWNASCIYEVTRRLFMSLTFIMNLWKKRIYVEFSLPNSAIYYKIRSPSGWRSPLTHKPGALPLDHTGGKAPRPHYRLSLRARHMAPLFKLPSPGSASMCAGRGLNVFNQRYMQHTVRTLDSWWADRGELWLKVVTSLRNVVGRGTTQ